MQSTSVIIFIAALAIAAVQYSEARYHPIIDLREEENSDNSFVLASFAERGEQGKIYPLYKIFFYQILI